MMLRISIIADVDIYNQSAWSGTISHLADILKDEYEIVPFEIKHNFMEKVCLVTYYANLNSQ